MVRNMSRVGWIGWCVFVCNCAEPDMGGPVARERSLALGKTSAEISGPDSPSGGASLLPAAEPVSPAKTNAPDRATTRFPRSTPPSGGWTYYRKIVGSPGCQPDIRPCQLADRGAGYGSYRVVSLRGRRERSPEGDLSAYTYVELARIAGPGPDAPVARIPGGPLPDGNDFPGPLTLSVGEVVGLILGKPDNEYYTLDRRAVDRNPEEFLAALGRCGSARGSDEATRPGAVDFQRAETGNDITDVSHAPVAGIIKGF